MLEFALITCIFLLSTRAALEPTQIVVTKEALVGGPPLKIAIYSDLHLAKGRAPREKLLGELEQAQPDFAVALGDFSEGQLSEADFAYLQNLFAVAPTYGVLGNNDLAPELGEELERAGLKLLRNQGLHLAEWNIYLYGVEDLRAGRPSFDDFQEEGEYKILLSHSPEIVRRELPKVDLILAGHTHGGQICLPGGLALVTHSKLGRKYSAGLFSWGESSLFITRGVGTSTLPLRLFCLPELAILELGAEKK